MTTLATLKADIADDIARSDLTTAIASAISRAISYYQVRRFWFNETRDETFTTVAGQSIYSSADDAEIPNFIEIDEVIVTIGGINRRLTPSSIDEWEMDNDNSASTGQPYDYVYYNDKLYLYPVPTTAYTVRLIGLRMFAAPATDDEANNVWMTDAYQLIRARSKADIAINKIRDTSIYQEAKALEDDEYMRLTRETGKRKRTGIIKATCF